MAIRYRHDLYPRDDPRDGSRLVRFTHQQEDEYSHVRNGTGAGRVMLRGTTSDAQLIDPRGLQYVRVVRENTVAATELVVGGYWFEQGDFLALDRKMRKQLSFGGAGTLAYLDREIMWSHAYLDISNFGDQDPFDDIWRLYAAGTGNELGAILWRVITEGQGFRVGTTPYTHRHGDGLTYTDIHDDDRLETAIPFVTLGFDQHEDSDGNPWTVSSGDFEAQVGESLYEVTKRLMAAGLYVELDPDTFELRAWEVANHGRDRTGSAWGADVVRFNPPPSPSTDRTAGNILNDLKRALRPLIRATGLLAGGQDTYGFATQGGDVPWHRFHASDVADVPALDALAGRQLGARNDAGDTVLVRAKVGADPANGYYLPGEHARTDDLATLDTGTDTWDWEDAAYPIAKWSVTSRRSGAPDVFYHLGASYHASGDNRFEGGAGVGRHTHPPNPELCRAGAAATPPVLEDSGTSKSDDQFSIPITVAGEPNNALYVAVLGSSPGVTWRPGFVNLGSPGTSVAMTQIASVATGGRTITVWRLLAPTDSTTGTSAVLITGNWQQAGAWYLSGVDQSDPEGVTTATGTGTESAISIAAGASDLILDAAGWSQTNQTVTTPTVAGSQVSIGAETTDRTTGFQDFASGYGYGSDTSPAWNFTNSHPWAAVAVAVAPSDTGTGGDGTLEEVGTSIRAARCDHNHHHNDLLDLNVKSGGHDAVAVNITDAGGHFTGTDVEAALQELAVDVAAAGGLPWFDVTAYGATGDGVTDDRAAINLAIAALVSAGGGVLYFPFGTYLVSAALTTISVPFLVLGDGTTTNNDTTEVGVSEIVCSSSTAVLFDITADVGYFEKIGMRNSHATPTAGAGIYVHGSIVGQRVSYNNVRVRRFYDNIDQSVGALWVMNDAYLLDAVRYDLRIRNTINGDAGDWAISNSIFGSHERATTSCIRIESSGGGKITNCKINSGTTDYTNGIDLAISGTTTTGILLISNCSIEGFTGAAIKGTVATGSSQWRHVVIHGNHVNPQTGTTGIAVSLVSTDAGDFSEIVISSNSFAAAAGSGRAAVQITNCDNVVFVANLISDNFTSLYSNSGSTNVVEVGGGVSDHGGLTGLADDDHTHYLNEARHDALPHAEGLLTVDPGTVTYDHSGDDVLVEVTALWGYDADGPYYDDAGVTVGEEAILALDPDTGEMTLVPYNP